MNTIPSITQTTPDERLMAAASHFTVLFFGMGAAAPAAIWAYQRSKSPFVSFHALQALAYQLLVWVYSIVLSLLFTIGLACLLPVIMTIAPSEEAAMPLVMLSQFLIFALLIGGFGLYILLGLAGAALTLLGREFRYPLLGNWMERYLRSGESPAEPLTSQTAWPAEEAP